MGTLEGHREQYGNKFNKGKDNSSSFSQKEGLTAPLFKILLYHKAIQILEKRFCFKLYFPFWGDKYPFLILYLIWQNTKYNLQDKKAELL